MHEQLIHSYLKARIGSEVITVTGKAPIDKAVNFCIELRKRFPNRLFITEIT